MLFEIVLSFEQISHLSLFFSFHSINQSIYCTYMLVLVPVLLITNSQKLWTDDNIHFYKRIPGAPLTFFNDGGVRQRFIFYTPKNPNFRICLPKKIPTFFSIPKKIPQCFCISKFYYLSSGKLKHANFNFGFGQKQNYKLRLCYCWFELMKNIIPQKIPALFSRPKKIPASFIDPKKSLSAEMSDPKKSFGPPVIKICEWGPWEKDLHWIYMWW